MTEHGDLKYYFSQTAIIVDYRGQFLSFNTYSSNKKKNFKKFQRTLINSSESQFSTINDIYGLARKHHLVATPGRNPQVVGNIAF